MKYEFTIMTIEEIGTSKKERPRRSIQIESENPLTVKEIKAKCFESLEIDLTKYDKVKEEVYANCSGKNRDANPDEMILDKREHERSDYYVTIKEKESK